MHINYKKIKRYSKPKRKNKFVDNNLSHRILNNAILYQTCKSFENEIFHQVAIR